MASMSKNEVPKIRLAHVCSGCDVFLFLILWTPDNALTESWFEAGTHLWHSRSPVVRFNAISQEIGWPLN